MNRMAPLAWCVVVAPTAVARHMFMRPSTRSHGICPAHEKWSQNERNSGRCRHRSVSIEKVVSGERHTARMSQPACLPLPASQQNSTRRQTDSWQRPGERRTRTQWKQPAAVIGNWRLVCARSTKGSLLFLALSLSLSPSLTVFLSLSVCLSIPLSESLSLSIYLCLFRSLSLFESPWLSLLHTHPTTIIVSTWPHHTPKPESSSSPS